MPFVLAQGRILYHVRLLLEAVEQRRQDTLGFDDDRNEGGQARKGAGKGEE